MTAIEVTVLGEPVPQGSKRVYGGRAVDDNAARLKPWRAAVTSIVAEAIPDGWDRTGPMMVSAIFVFPRPVSHYNARGELRPTAPRYKHNRPGDIDKISRSVLDACTDARIWKDDSQVALLMAQRVYGERPCLQLAVQRIDGTETDDDQGELVEPFKPADG